MKNSNGLFHTIFIVFMLTLSLISFTNSSNAEETSTFYKDLGQEYDENLNVQLYTNGQVIYQVYKEDEFRGSLYKVNVINQNGEHKGTYNFPENSLSDDVYLTSRPVIDHDGNLLISYVVFNTELEDSPFYLASINSNGKLNWEFETGLHGPNSPVVGADGSIYFVASERKIMTIASPSLAYALTANGKVIWKKSCLGVCMTLLLL